LSDDFEFGVGTDFILEEKIPVQDNTATTSPVMREEENNQSAAISEPAVDRAPKQKRSLLDRLRGKNREIAAGFRDSTGNPDWEGDIIVLQAEEYHMRGRIYMKLAVDPGTPDELRRRSWESLNKRDENYIHIDPNATIKRKRNDVQQWREWLKYIIIAIIFFIVGAPITNLLFGIG
jgi:hypothetical protein